MEQYTEFRNGERSLITSVRLYEGPGHDRVVIFNRGAQAGELMLQKGDGMYVASKLCPAAERRVVKE